MLAAKTLFSQGFSQNLAFDSVSSAVPVMFMRLNCSCFVFLKNMNLRPDFPATLTCCLSPLLLPDGDGTPLPEAAITHGVDTGGGRHLPATDLKSECPSNVLNQAQAHRLCQSGAGDWPGRVLLPEAGSWRFMIIRVFCVTFCQVEDQDDRLWSWAHLTCPGPAVYSFGKHCSGF